MIKKDDLVVVAGEANEVFRVISFAKNGNPVLDTGFVEPLHKCTVIPEEYHEEIYEVNHSFIDTEIMMKIIDKDSQ